MMVTDNWMATSNFFILLMVFLTNIKPRLKRSTA